MSHLRDLLAASLTTTPHQGAIRFNTTWHNLPHVGSVINALTVNGIVVRVEVDDEEGTRFAGPNQDYFRSELIGWWLDPPEPELTLSERQERAQYEGEIEDQQRQYEEAE